MKDEVISVSEDGRELTVFERTDDASVNTDDTDQGDTGSDGLGFDVSSVPEEHRPVFEQLVSRVKEQQASMDNLKTRADMADLMKSMLDRRVQGDQRTEPEVKPQKLVDQLKFADDDYYAPFFKSLASAIDQIGEQFGNVTRSVENETKQAFEGRAAKYFADNGVTQDVIAKMDELASTFGDARLGHKNPAYKDLARLHKLALAELGKLPASKPEQKKQDNPKKRIEMGSARKSQTEPKKVASMKDAFDLAREQIAER